MYVLKDTFRKANILPLAPSCYVSYSSLDVIYISFFFLSIVCTLRDRSKLWKKLPCGSVTSHNQQLEIGTTTHNILGCIGKHSFSYKCKRMRMLSKHSYVFFYTVYLIINNEYKSMVFIILLGCLPYSNDWNILECECMYGMYGSYYDWNHQFCDGS